VEVWLDTVWAMLHAVGGGLMDFWGLQCRVVAVVVGSIDCVVATVACYEVCY
jgi:hypothetical protein